MEPLPPDGGGNVVAAPEFIVRRTASIGDAVAATVIADKLKEQGHGCVFQTHGNIHSVLRFCPGVKSLDTPRGFCHVNLDGVYEKDPYRRTKTFNEYFLGKANDCLGSYGIKLPNENAKASLFLDQEAKQIAKAKFTDYPKPWVFVCPRSNSYIVRQVPDVFWIELVKHLPGTKFWMGQHPPPTGFVDLQLRHLNNLVVWSSAADILVSVDTGPAHIAGAFGVPMVLLGQASSPELHFSDQRDFETVWPTGDLDCLNCQQNICPKSRYSPPCQAFDAEQVAKVVTEKLDVNRIAALIPTYNADPHMLTKAVQNVVGQVDEVILTVAADGKVSTPITHPKVRIVRCPKGGIGFGRNVNFGFRHTRAAWVLLLNDDCYLNDGTVGQLRSACSDGVGMIAHLLRYPNGKIYFAGRLRHNGERGFPHVNHGDYHPAIQSVTEMEAVSCTSVLINRKAFYQIGGFDERFFMYAEDDDISMRMRQAGYKLLYHPTALGVHEGSATVRQTGKQMQWIRTSGALMEKLWGWYWTKNKNTIPGVFK